MVWSLTPRQRLGHTNNGLVVSFWGMSALGSFWASSRQILLRVDRGLSIAGGGARGNYGLAALMLVTSVCSFLADYVHIEETRSPHGSRPHDA